MHLSNRHGRLQFLYLLSINIDLLAEGRIDTESLVTHKFPLDQVSKEDKILIEVEIIEQKYQQNYNDPWR